MRLALVRTTVWLLFCPTCKCLKCKFIFLSMQSHIWGNDSSDSIRSSKGSGSKVFLSQNLQWCMWSFEDNANFRRILVRLEKNGHWASNLAAMCLGDCNFRGGNDKSPRLCENMLYVLLAKDMQERIQRCFFVLGCTIYGFNSSKQVRQSFQPLSYEEAYIEVCFATVWYLATYAQQACYVDKYSDACLSQIQMMLPNLSDIFGVLFLTRIVSDPFLNRSACMTELPHYYLPSIPGLLDRFQAASADSSLRHVWTSNVRYTLEF